MTRISKALIGIALAGTFGWAAPASAQNTRSWVSGEGDDANPCGRNSPCRTFAGAISKTLPGGTIHCLDPHSYGGVNITKSISIICQYTGAGVAGFNNNAITVNAAATDVVFLSGLDINGQAGIANPGTNGIRIIGAGAVHIQDSRISNFRQQDSFGIRIQPGTVTHVTVSDTTISDNGLAMSGGGIFIQPTMAGSTRVTLRNVLLQNNGNNQIRVDTTGNAGPGVGITLLVDDSQLLGGTNGISINQAAMTASVTTMITDSYIALCSGSGLITAGTNTVRMRVADTTITACATGVTQGASTVINTWENNRVEGNGVPGTFTLPALTEK
jgi:hypothetical protein